MSFSDTLNKFEERRFLELTREDAELIANQIDHEYGNETNILTKTENTVKDASFIASHPWFVPYVIATEYIDKLQFSPETAEYLRTHPVVPGNEFFPENIAEENTTHPMADPPVPLSQATTDPTEVTKVKKVRISEETPKDDTVVDEQGEQGPHSRRHHKEPTAVVKSNQNISNDNRTSLKLTKISKCFLTVVGFVSKGVLPIPVYFESVVLPYILKKDANANAILTTQKPSGMDEILFILAACDNGAKLSSVGFEMILSAVHSAGVKYGHDRVHSIVSHAIRQTAESDLRSAYMRCFPRFPVILEQMLSEIKVGIIGLKK